MKLAEMVSGNEFLNEHFPNARNRNLKTGLTREIRIPQSIYTGGHRSPRALPTQQFVIPTPDEMIRIVDCVD